MWKSRSRVWVESWGTWGTLGTLGRVSRTAAKTSNALPRTPLPEFDPYRGSTSPTSPTSTPAGEPVSGRMQPSHVRKFGTFTHSLSCRNACPVGGTSGTSGTSGGRLRGRRPPFMPGGLRVLFFFQAYVPKVPEVHPGVVYSSRAAAASDSSTPYFSYSRSSFDFSPGATT